MKVERRRACARLLAVLAALVIMALSAAVATAHTLSVTKADPAVGSTIAKAPAQAMAQFSEEVLSQGSTFKVLDAGGQQVSQGNGKLDLNDPNHQIMLAALPNPLPDGVYTVQYHVVAADGDATDGSYKFTVQSGADPAAQQAATGTPAAAATGAPTAVATSAPTAVATSVATAAPTSAAAATANAAAQDAAQPTAANPGALPTTGGSAGSQWPWLLAVGVIVAALGLTATLRRNAR